MLCFLSSECEPSSKVTKDKIYFVSVPDGSSNETIKMLVASKAKLFANTLNLDKVYLHFGKETIIYDYTI